MKHFEPVFVGCGISRISRLDCPEDALFYKNLFKTSKVKIDNSMIQSFYPCYLIDTSLFQMSDSVLELHDKDYTLAFIDMCLNTRCHNSKEEKDYKNLYKAVK